MPVTVSVADYGRLMQSVSKLGNIRKLPYKYLVPNCVFRYDGRDFTLLEEAVSCENYQTIDYIINEAGHDVNFYLATRIPCCALLPLQGGNVKMLIFLMRLGLYLFSKDCLSLDLFCSPFKSFKFLLKYGANSDYMWVSHELLKETYTPEL
jgi:hypothetical protein